MIHKEAGWLGSRLSDWLWLIANPALAEICPPTEHTLTLITYCTCVLYICTVHTHFLSKLNQRLSSFPDSKPENLPSLPVYLQVLFHASLSPAIFQLSICLPD